MNLLPNLKYTKEHEWIRIEGNRAYIGITDYAQHSLGDIVFVDLPEKGKSMKAGQALGVVESVKAVSDVYCPLSGTIIEVNQELIDAPEKINEAPYDSWIAVIDIVSQEEIEKLLSSEQYMEICSQES